MPKLSISPSNLSMPNKETPKERVLKFVRDACPETKKHREGWNDRYDCACCKYCYKDWEECNGECSIGSSLGLQELLRAVIPLDLYNGIYTLSATEMQFNDIYGNATGAVYDLLKPLESQSDDFFLSISKILV